MLYNELVRTVGGTSTYTSVRLKDDFPPHIRSNHGIGILSSLFGARCRIINDNMPWVEHMELDEIRKAVGEGRARPHPGAGQAGPGHAPLLPREAEGIPEVLPVRADHAARPAGPVRHRAPADRQRRVPRRRRLSRPGARAAGRRHGHLHRVPEDGRPPADRPAPATGPSTCTDACSAARSWSRTTRPSSTCRRRCTGRSRRPTTTGSSRRSAAAPCITAVRRGRGRTRPSRARGCGASTTATPSCRTWRAEYAYWRERKVPILLWGDSLCLEPKDRPFLDDIRSLGIRTGMTLAIRVKNREEARAVLEQHRRASGKLAAHEQRPVPGDGRPGVHRQLGDETPARPRVRGHRVRRRRPVGAAVAPAVCERAEEDPFRPRGRQRSRAPR